ncbi:MAG: YggT family protein [Acidimicrobiales bacterium]
MGDLFCILLLLFQFVFLSRIALSFFPIRPGTPAGTAKDLAFALTDPVVWPLRRRLPPVPGPIGFGIAELVVLLLLVVVLGIIC